MFDAVVIFIIHCDLNVYYMIVGIINNNFINNNN